MRKLIAIILLMTVCGVVSSEEIPEWKIKLSLGATTTSGNSETLTANSNAQGKYDSEKYDTLLSLDGNYGETTLEDESKEINTQNWKASFNIKRLLGKPFVYVDGSGFHDEIAKVDLRAIGGIGGGIFLIKDDSIKWSIVVGAAWVYEDLAVTNDNGELSYRAATRFDHKLNAGSKLWLTGEFLPTTEDFSDYLTNSELGIESAITKVFSLRTTIKSVYDSTPASGQEELDLSLIGAIVYTL
jgi:putative salt-induced outer membrane protein YdiY